MKKILLVLTFLSIYMGASAQKQFTRTAHVHVHSSNNIHNVDADNYQVFSILDTPSGALEFTALLKSFEFQVGALNRMMNTRTLNVTQYPKIIYKGNITNLSTINFSRPGKYTVKVKGILYIWDEQRHTAATGTLTVHQDGTISAVSNFDIVLEEKNVNKINQLMRAKLPNALGIDANTLGVSRTINIKADMTYQKQ